MKTSLTTHSVGVICALALTSISASAGLITFDSTAQNGGTPIDITVPDGNSVGIVSTLNASSLGGGYVLGQTLNFVSVTLNISGGNNGDLYAYLGYGGKLVPLLNRPGLTGDSAGLGYTTAGFNNVHLSDGAAYASINTTPSPTYGGTYNAPGGSVAFQAFNGLNPNGNWSLFISDLAGGDTTFSRLESWSLTLEPVPEPANVALGIFGVVFACGALCRTRRMRGWLHRGWASFTNWVDAV